MTAQEEKNPDFFNEEVKRYLKKHYNIDGKIHRLVSYDDQNFLVTDKKNTKHVLKISNTIEKKEFLNAQSEVLKYLKKKCSNYQFPNHFETAEGKIILSIKDDSGFSYFARLLNYVPGTFLRDLKNHSENLLYKFGEFLATMDKALLEFDHPAFHRNFTWDLKNALQAYDRLKYIKSSHKRRIAEYFLLQFETHVSPQFHRLRSSLIHGDANDWNVLISQNESGGEIVGVIDFGDMVFSQTINELAIALVYVLFNKENPLATAKHVIRGYNSVLPLEELELELLYHLICGRLCIGVTMYALSSLKYPENDYVTISEKPAWELLEKLIRINPRQAEKEFKQACQMVDSFNSNRLHQKQILNLRQQYIGKSLSISYDKPLKIVRGALQYLYDDIGKTYLDAVNNVPHVGHCHPKVVKAAQKQLAVLNTNTRYLHDNLVLYAQRLTDKIPDPLNVCFFTNSGSEAIDLALRLARNYTGQKDIIVVESAYHGTTTADIEISAYKFDGSGGSGAESYIHKVETPDTYRGRYKAADAEAGKKYAAQVKNVIEQMQKKNKKPAAFICESLMGVAGQIVLPENYLKEVFHFVRQADGLCIADEVQIGFGRVGTHFWGFETQDVVPDIVTLGKPIGNGFPLAAVVTTLEIADAFANGMEYFNTYGGNPVSCAVGLAVLDVIEQEKLQENALRVGAYLKKRLESLKDEFKLIGDVRGTGLFIGIELVRDHKTLEPADTEAVSIVEKMKNNGILISTDGPFHNVLKIKPPIIFNRENAGFLVDTLCLIFLQRNLKHF
ncbi:aminotransferase class III-fold pyridoxal phosphate-dependent enzyme [candidate division KSB1 bacterium]|nr:aminotransferase class III-fold pyridoxal phosphate-dependent enzyme [candidate division KSB1 bacterium]MBL7094770.1 aminotransferase class III-fold pyridoxal phosphate-dependent enzyme [candidate division KSB1 bacterium]